MMMMIRMKTMRMSFALPLSDSKQRLERRSPKNSVGASPGAGSML